MTMKPAQPPTAEALSRAHARLLEDLRDLEHETEAPPADPARRARCLARVRLHIAEHFAFEEQDGYMGAVLERRPNLERAVEELRGDHRRLADALDGLIAQAGTAGESFGDRVRAWVEDVRRHESRENGLVQDAFNVDTGVED
jgi:hypothetical protein